MSAAAAPAAPLASPRAARLAAARAWRPAPSDWRAWHIFLHRTDALETLLIDAVRPELKRLSGRPGFQSFFIRYWENGPHVRLRVRGLGEAEFAALGTRLRAGAEAIAGTLDPAPGRFPDQARFDGWHADPAALPWFPAGTVAEIDYEPEWRRYGGRHGLAVHESLFQASSALALAVIAATRDAAEVRWSLALALTASAIGAVCDGPESVHRFLARMRANWSAFTDNAGDVEAQAAAALRSHGASLAELARAAVGGAPAGPSEPVRRWHAAVRDHAEELRELAALGLLVSPLTGAAPGDAGQLEAALHGMFVSQVHMMNNRLGLSPQQEFQFAAMLLAALEEIGDDRRTT